MEPFGLFQFLQSLLSSQGGTDPSSQGNEAFSQSGNSPSSTPSEAPLSNPLETPSSAFSSPASTPTQASGQHTPSYEENPASRFLEKHEKRAGRKKQLRVIKRFVMIDYDKLKNYKPSTHHALPITHKRSFACKQRFSPHTWVAFIEKKPSFIQ